MSFLLFSYLTRFFRKLFQFFYFLKFYLYFNKLRLFSLFLFIIFLFLINFLTNFRQKEHFLPFCKEQNLGYFYKFYSLKEYSQPDKTPLNWINIKLVWEPLLKPKLYYKNKNNYNNSFSSLFIVVISKLEHFKQRKFLRKEFKEQGISSFIFVLSIANASKQTIKSINEEFAKEGDLLVLSNLKENYRLLTYKTRAWLQWVTKQFSLICGPPRFILKIDDDLMV